MIQSNQLTSDYCISCTYFQQTKGNFGNCSIINNKPYDGTKKGSATNCPCWRIKTKLLEEEKLTQLDQQTIKASSLRVTYNSQYKNRKNGNIKITNVDGKFVSFTTDLYSKNGYYKHRYNFRIIDRALTLFLTGLSYKEIAEDFKKNNYRVPDKNTIKGWVINILGKEAYGYWLRCKCGGNLVKNGKGRRLVCQYCS